MIAVSRAIALAVLLSGCASTKQPPPYDGPFTVDQNYTTIAPVSVWVGDTPFESGVPQPTPAPRRVRDASVLAPDTRVRFIRQDAPYLVFLVLSGDTSGRYVWIDQHSEEIRNFQPLVTAPG